MEEFKEVAIKPGRINPASGDANEHYKNISIKFRYVEERDLEGNGGFVSRHVEWTAKESRVVYGMISTKCEGKGSLELGPGDSITDEQYKQMQMTCKEEKTGVIFGYFWLPQVISPPDVVEWEKLRNGCFYSEQRPGYRYSVRVVETGAIVEIDTDEEYRDFVPEPNGQILFDVRSNIPALFRFTLEQVSNFSGYATNADVDDAFFNRYGLTDLRGKYGNKDPDLIFDPRYYDGSEYFRRTGWNMVETVKELKNPGVIVTAMDYGAHGLLRVEAKGRCGWEPVRILIDGQDKDFITIPMDEDKNLIADLMSIYNGDPGRDDDQKPKGDGTSGDGFTSFEEYRGFMIRNGANDCRDASKDVHIRTDPAWKDLFIDTSSPTLLKLIPLFSASSGLNVHNICPRHYVDNEKRVVNFTLQSGGPKVWQGKTVSQKVPEHGLYLINASLQDGTLGETFSGDPARPKNVTVVKIDVNQCLRLGRMLSRIVRRDVGPILLASVLVHELGHSVGIPHHDDGSIVNLEEALVITGEACPRGTTPVANLANYELPDGANACWAKMIARRHAQNSGDDKCPIKYAYWLYYESPNSPLKDVGNIQFQDSDGNQHELPGYTGNIRLYRMDLDFPGLGEFCVNTRGGGINALPGDQNHAGDASHTCADKIHVNDVR